MSAATVTYHELPPMSAWAAEGVVEAAAHAAFPEPHHHLLHQPHSDPALWQHPPPLAAAPPPSPSSSAAYPAFHQHYAHPFPSHQQPLHVQGDFKPFHGITFTSALAWILLFHYKRPSHAHVVVDAFHG